MINRNALLHIPVLQRGSVLMEEIYTEASIRKLKNAYQFPKKPEKFVDYSYFIYKKSGYNRHIFEGETQDRVA